MSARVWHLAVVVVGVVGSCGGEREPKPAPSVEDLRISEEARQSGKMLERSLERSRGAALGEEACGGAAAGACDGGL